MGQRMLFRIKKKLKRIKNLNNKGQSLVEYILILGLVTGISYAFLSLANQEIAKIWVQMVKLISGNNSLNINQLL